MFEKTRKRWNFLQWELSIYRGEGGQFQEPASIRPLRGFRRTRVHSDVLRVTFFTEIQKISWNWIVGVNPLPWGASVGEFRKNLPPSKRRVCRNSWNKFSGWLNPWRSGILNLRSPEVANLWRSEILNLWSPEVANLWRFGIMNLRSPEVANLWRSGIVNLRSLEVANLWRYRVMNLQSSEVMNLRNSRIGNLWSSGIYWSPNSEVMAHEDFHE
jgi:hypothetical protein